MTQREHLTAQRSWDPRLRLASFAFVSLGLAFSSANPLATAAVVIVVPIFVRLLWVPGEPPILLALVLVQWLQVSLRVLDADFRGIALADIPVAGAGSLELATLLGLVGLGVLALGQRIGLGIARFPARRSVSPEAAPRPKQLFLLFLGFQITGLLLAAMRWRFLALMQVFGAFSALRWVPLFLLAHVVIRDRVGRSYLVAAVLLEVIVGFGSYFSEFKTVFFVLLLAACSTRVRMSRREWGIAALTTAVAVGLSMAWLGIREDYRMFLRQGESGQVIRVSWPDRLAEAGRLMTTLSSVDLADALRLGAERVAYVDRFAQSLEYVPAYTPHAAGEIWTQALKNTVMPRLFFPDKPVLPSDSELTMRYTGQVVASGARGTSISLGYMAESYVDFGFAIMWAPIFLVGLIQGVTFRAFVQRAPTILVGYGFAIAAVLPGLLFETATVKYVGGTLYMVVVLGAFMWLLNRLYARLHGSAQVAHVELGLGTGPR